MKIIRISTDLELTTHEFPEGKTICEQNKVLRGLIGPGCSIYEHVMPKRLYKVLGGSNRVTKRPGDCVNMLVDEEGLLKGLPYNMVGSYLYETDIHKHYIVGNILIAGEVMTEDGICFCDISEEQFNLLYPKLKNITEKARERL